MSTLQCAPAGQATNEELLVEVGRGNGAAFNQLYDRLAPLVYGLTVRIVGNPSLAQDSAQETMLDVWRSAPRFNAERGSALTWALTIAHRRGVDHVRAQRAAQAREWRVGIANLEPSLDQMDDLVIHRVDSERIRQLLTVLTPLQRETVDLVYYEGRTVTEIATLLSVPVSTVKSRLHLALHRLRSTYRPTRTPRPGDGGAPKYPNAALGALNAPNATLGASNAPNATLGASRPGRRGEGAGRAGGGDSWARGGVRAVAGLGIVAADDDEPAPLRSGGQS